MYMHGYEFCVIHLVIVCICPLILVFSHDFKTKNRSSFFALYVYILTIEIIIFTLNIEITRHILYVNIIVAWGCWIVIGREHEARELLVVRVSGEPIKTDTAKPLPGSETDDQPRRRRHHPNTVKQIILF